MLRIVLTLDYELHGNGDGCPRALMIEPTYRLLRLCDEFEAKLTIMADVAEILKFREYKERVRRDDYCYDAIVEQLRHAISTGHDVQLHIHSSYFNARHEGARWTQDWSEYNFASLPYERMDWMVRTSKQFLEDLLAPVDPQYRCIAFRAANWAVNPSQSVVRALLNNGMKIDTSVFKYGRRNGLVNFDYSQAYSQMVPWRANEDDICGRDDTSRLWEVPIYSEKRWIGAFLTLGRIYRLLAGRAHKVLQRAESDNEDYDGSRPRRQTRGLSLFHTVFRRHAWKADFNQCSGRQLVNALDRASRGYDHRQRSLPFVLIGHSKLFTVSNERNFRRFLAHAAQCPSDFSFDTLLGVSRSLALR